MKKHLFFTGEKQIGKSTLLRRILQERPISLGGFFTVKTQGVFPGCPSVHLLQAGSKDRPSPENLLFCCGKKEADTAGRFDRLGCAALEKSRSAELLIMDELGPHEGEAKEFCSAIQRALDGPLPILGVLQQAEAPFLAGIASHPQVCVLTVTRENREELAQRFTREFWAEIGGRHSLPHSTEIAFPTPKE